MFNIEEVNSIAQYDTITRQMEYIANSKGIDLDNNRDWVRSAEIVTGIEWGEIKPTSTKWRTVRAYLDEVARTIL